MEASALAIAGEESGDSRDNDAAEQPSRTPSAAVADLEPTRAASSALAVRLASNNALVAAQRGRNAAAQTGPDAAPIDWLPGELLALVFGFVGAKTLTATIPAVSPCRMWMGG